MLELLSNSFGPSGYEDEVVNIIENFMSEYCDETKIDSMGNLICHKTGKKVNGKSIMLTAHIDEVGFIISHITEEGYLKFQTLGGIDPGVLISKRVVIGEKRICGVIGTKPVHLNPESKKIKISDLYIDIGAKNYKDALNYVDFGDYACFDSKFVEFGNGLIKGKALDDRIGCFIMMETAKLKLDADIYYTFVVQEEIGCRGSKIVTSGINPDFAIVLEGTTCSDVPGTGKYEFTTHLGNGPALSIRDGGCYSDVSLTEEIVEIAERNNLKFQYKQSTSGGNDASSIQISGKGNRVAAISVPCRYIHSQSNVASKNDIQNTIILIKCIIEEKILNEKGCD